MQMENLVVRHVLHQLQQLRILPEKFAANIRAALRLERLILAVHALFHPPQQQPRVVALEQLIPVRTPDHLDHVPARAEEHRLQLVDDPPVPAHRPIQPLQVAVHHEDQVVELLPPPQRQRAQRVHFVRFAVAQERPDLPRRLLNQPAVLQIPHEPRLIHRIQRSDPHRHRREIPEIRHQPRVRIRRQSRLLPQLMPEVQHPLVIQPPQQKRPRINPRRRVSLEINKVPRLIAVLRVEEMVEPHLQQRRQRRVRRDVPADAVVLLVLPVHHRHRVPADQRLDPPLQLSIARIRHFLMLRNRVHIRRGQLARLRDPCLARPLLQRRQQLRALLRTLAHHHIVKCFDPLPHLLRKNRSPPDYSPSLP